MIKSIKPSKMYIGRLTHGSDLLQEITDLCINKNIKLGRVEGIGAVQKARVEYYNQAAREYQYIEFNNHLEITKLEGPLRGRFRMGHRDPGTSPDRDSPWHL